MYYRYMVYGYIYYYHKKYFFFFFKKNFITFINMKN